MSLARYLTICGFIIKVNNKLNCKMPHFIFQEYIPTGHYQKMNTRHTFQIQFTRYLQRRVPTLNLMTRLFGYVIVITFLSEITQLRTWLWVYHCERNGQITSIYIAFDPTWETQTEVCFIKGHGGLPLLLFLDLKY